MSGAMGVSQAERQKAKAMARWEGEGGALGPAPAKRAAVLDEADVRILSRLGAAVLSQWSKLPADLQRTIVSRASTSHAAISRLLQEHSDS
jgi:hypothetical protein